MRLQLSTTKHLPTPPNTIHAPERGSVSTPPTPSPLLVRSFPNKCRIQPPAVASTPRDRPDSHPVSRSPSPVPRPRASRRAKTSPRCPHRRVDPTSSGRPACTRPGPAGHSLSGGSFLSLAHNRLHSQRHFFLHLISTIWRHQRTRTTSQPTRQKKPQQNARDGEKDELILSIGALDYNYPPSCIHVI